MKPLSEQALRERITKIVFNYPKPDSPNLGETIDEIMNLILQDRKAWGEYVIGEPPYEIDNITLDVVDNEYNSGLRFYRVEQRKRNQGEKTDE